MRPNARFVDDKLKDFSLFGLGELATNFQQFLFALVCRLWIRHLEVFKHIDDDLRHNEPCVLFIVSGNDIPGRFHRKRCVCTTPGDFGFLATA